MVLVVLILNMCVLDFCVVSGLISLLLMVALMVFNLWIGPGVMLGLVDNF